jgi:two-component system NarL family response regulator
MRAGAKAYLLKDGRREEILECIRKVHHGETCVPPHLTAKLATRIGAEPLSKRETDVLLLLGRGKSNKEIGASLHISETTVKSHLKSVFAKLRVLSRTEAVATAVERGLIEL